MSSLLSRKDLVAKLLKSKKFRDAYVYEHVRNGIPFQTRAMREERNWSQAVLGEAVKKPRNVITRLENPNYGKLTLKTLFEIASGFDVAVLIKFVPFSRLLKEYEDVSSEALYAKSIIDEEEIEKLNEWAVEEEVEPISVRADETVSRHPFNVIQGKGNTTPTQGLFRFMQEVERQSSPKARNFAGKHEQPETDEETETQGWNLLTMTAGGQR